MNIWNRLYLQACLLYVMKDDTSLNLPNNKWERLCNLADA